MTLTALPTAVTEGRIVPVLTIHDAATARAVGEGLLSGGIGCVEVTLRTAAGWEAAEILARELPELAVGIGTVLTAEQAERAHASGAQFVVSPGYSDAMVGRAQELGLSVIPGVATPSEVMAAIARGLGTVKLFPARELGGPGYVRTLTSVFPTTTFVPSGGIDATLAADYLALPSVVAVSGTWMLPADAVASGDRARIAALSAEAVAAARR